MGDEFGRGKAPERLNSARVLHALAEEARVVKAFAEGIKVGGRLGPEQHQRLVLAVSRITNATRYTEALPLDEVAAMTGERHAD